MGSCHRFNLEFYHTATCAERQDLPHNNMCRNMGFINQQHVLNMGFTTQQHVLKDDIYHTATCAEMLKEKVFMLVSQGQGYSVTNTVSLLCTEFMCLHL